MSQKTIAPTDGQQRRVSTEVTKSYKRFSVGNEKVIHEMPAKDLGNFTDLPGSVNRDIMAPQNKQHLAALGEAIKKSRRITPITVNKHLQVLDGQNRLYWARELAIPVRYTIEMDAGIEFVITENRYHKDWTMFDLVRSYANQKIKDYILLVKFIDEVKCGENIVLAALLLSAQQSRTRQLQQSILDGLFKVFDYTKAVGDFRKISQIVTECGLEETSTKQIYFALVKLIRQTWYAHDMFVEKACKNSKSLRACVTYDEYLDGLLGIYNLGLKGKERFKW